jgi:tryptophan halogenase
MALPDTLQDKIDTFRAHGRIFRFNEELFAEVGWLQVLVGQGILPRSYHPLADSPGDENVDRYLAGIREVIQAKVARMPDHREHLTRLGGLFEEVAA